MKKLSALILAALMCLSLASCATTSPTGSAGSADDFSGDVTLKVMLMTSGDMNADTVKQVTAAVNDRIKELGHEFKVEFTWAGSAWGFENLDTELQTGSAPDIIPAHTWSGSVTYTVGAQNGQYLRLDDPANNLLEKYGKDIYAKTAAAVKAAATIPGDKGAGIYGYIIEKDSVSQLGYLVNKTLLEELGFTMSDFNADDLASWKPLMEAYKAAYPQGYPLNIEGEVLDRTANHIAFVDNTNGPLGVVFDNANPAGTNVSIASRYESETYKSFLGIMGDYYDAGFVDPDQGVQGEVAKASVANRRTSGDFLISTYVYAPGAENMISKSATEAQGKDVEIVWAPGWSSPIATTDTALGSGLAVYAGTNYAPEAVTFLNMLAGDTIMGNLVSEGVEGLTYEVKDGILWRLPDRAGWEIWRYGVAGCASAITPLGDVDADGNELTLLKDFNNASAALACTGWLFDVQTVDAEYSACIATIDKYAVPLATGASEASEYDAFIAELKANGLDAVVSEAEAQYTEWAAAK